MDLKDFVKETLVQIVKGIDEANEELKSSTAFMASSNVSSGGSPWKYTKDKDGSYHYVTDVDFDVAVDVKETKTSEKGGGVEVLSIVSFGGKGEKEKESNSTHRVKFVLPLALPTEPEEKKYPGRR